VLLAGDNWAIFEPTQYADVRDRNLPPDGFCERLAQVAPRQKRQGMNVARAQERPGPYLPFEPETVPVPAGPFLMGSDRAKDPQAREDEFPQHTVALPDYRIGKYPVTVGEYRAFVEAGGYRERRWWSGAGWEWRAQENRAQPLLWDYELWTGDELLPVIGITWFEADAYCRWLAEVTKRPYRLPTEAEWEKAARGTDGRIYPWGNARRGGVCNSFEVGTGHTRPVDACSPAGDSPYGAADMSGNVWEWTSTIYRDYPYDPRDGRESNKDADAGRVLRGGAWDNPLDHARAAYRDSCTPNHGSVSVGFRVACAPPLPGLSDL
jgi:formylglycine-generating enzyme required for sulfatase activity